jgi:tricarballylate dehydrogenase
VNDRAQVLFGDYSSNCFAAGEIMAGNVLGQGYVAGVGMTIGTVYGRLAGQQAALAAQGLAEAPANLVASHSKVAA